jgi:hypothetical protein
MSSFDELYGSRFLAATDLRKPVVATIERVEEENFARDGAPPKRRKVLYFENATKGIVLNKVNASTLATAFTENFATWPGRQTTIRPESALYNGKVVPALRLYPMQNTKAVEPPPPPPEDDNEEMPF